MSSRLSRKQIEKLKDNPNVNVEKLKKSLDFKRKNVDKPIRK